MVLEFEADTFVSRTGSGNQTITGVGFTPKVIILNSLVIPTFNSFTVGSDARFYFGFTASTTAVNQRSFFYYNYDGETTSDVDTGWHTSSIINDGVGGGSFDSLATLSTFNADGFVLNWSINGSFTSGVNFDYIALGGDDITNASSGDFNTPNTTGDHAITGVGFRPDFVILLGTNYIVDDDVSATIGTYSLGYFNSNGEQAVSSIISEDGADTSDTARYQRVNKCLAMFAIADTTTLTHEATFVSMNNDGFTLNYTTASVANKRVAYLAVKGCQTKIGSFTSPTAGTAPVSQSTNGVGFQPRGIIFQTVGKTSGTSIVAHARMSFGYTNDPDDEFLTWFGDEDNVATTVTACRHDNSNCIRVSDEASSGGSTTTQALANFTQFDEDGFTLNWSVKDASNAYEVIYIALGDATAAGGQEGRKRISTSMIQRPTLVTTNKRYISTNIPGGK